MKSSARPKTFAYFDTSVIVKNYIREAGSNRARQLLRTHRVVTSAFQRWNPFRLSAGILSQTLLMMQVTPRS